MPLTSTRVDNDYQPTYDFMKYGSSYNLLVYYTVDNLREHGGLGYCITTTTYFVEIETDSVTGDMYSYYLLYINTRQVRKKLR
jgi:hypothetical protein